MYPYPYDPYGARPMMISIFQRPPPGAPPAQQQMPMMMQQPSASTSPSAQQPFVVSLLHGPMAPPMQQQAPTIYLLTGGPFGQPDPTAFQQPQQFGQAPTASPNQPQVLLLDQSTNATPPTAPVPQFMYYGHPNLQQQMQQMQQQMLQQMQQQVQQQQPPQMMYMEPSPEATRAAPVAPPRPQIYVIDQSAASEPSLAETRDPIQNPQMMMEQSLASMSAPQYIFMDQAGQPIQQQQPLQEQQQQQQIFLMDQNEQQIPQPMRYGGSYSSMGGY